MDPIPSKVLWLIKNECNENPNLDYITNSIFIGNNILENNIPNKYIRNVVNDVTYPPAIGVRLGEWLINSVNNKVKDVSYKILHIIYPVKHVLECFKLNIEYCCEFCSNEK